MSGRLVTTNETAREIGFNLAAVDAAARKLDALGSASAAGLAAWRERAPAA